MLHCHRCKKPIPVDLLIPVSRQDVCRSCFSDVRCCLHCEYYDISAYNQCRESQAERIVEKTKANFCGYFKVMSKNLEEQQNLKAEQLAKAHALFKK
jgi:hypothetical protein